MTTNWQRPRDEHGRFAKPAAEPRFLSTREACEALGLLPDEPAATYAGRHHEFELGPQMGLCRACGGGWADWPHSVRKDPHLPDPPRAECSWWTDLDQARRTTLLALLPFVIALLGLGFSVAALIVGVQR